YAKSWDTRFGPDISTDHFLDVRWHNFTALLDRDFQGAAAVELGVGTAIYIERASQIFSNIIAVDGSANMLRETERRANALGLTNVATLQADVVSMPAIRTESLDVAYFFGLIEHVIQTDLFVSEVKRILKPNGIVIGSASNAKCPWYNIRRLFWGMGKHCTSDSYYTIEEIQSLFGRSGFTYEAVRYWGMVPPGLKSRTIFSILAFWEPIISRTPLSKFLGGMTFRFRK
ncbi:MAG TPA: class I SAM-dependent methyltransferase, partial [Desulfobacterales bacterium]|nr:class I SAM-dependent methyltransferase [Desulfobacterales bacterium]